MFDRQQGTTESVDYFVTDIVNIAKKVQISDPAIVRFALLQGFQPYIRQRVLHSSVDTLEETIKIARNTEAAFNDTIPDETKVEALEKEVRALKAAFQDLQSQARSSIPEPEHIANVDDRQHVSSSPIDASSSSNSRLTAHDQQRAEQVARLSIPSSRPLIQNSPQNWAGPADPSSWQRPNNNFSGAPRSGHCATLRQALRNPFVWHVDGDICS